MSELNRSDRPLSRGRLDEIRAALPLLPPVVAELLDEVERSRERFDELARINDEIIDAVGRQNNMVFHPFQGALCRVCRISVDGKPDGCDRHSPKPVLRRIAQTWANLNDRYREQEEQAAARGRSRTEVWASRGMEAYTLFGIAMELLRPLHEVSSAVPDVVPEETPGRLLREGIRRASALSWRSMSTRKLRRLLSGDPTALPPLPPAEKPQ
ncbi:hypothetical protein ACIBCC_29895 [Streptomyces griseus]|uniref:hypothetical protein n=1 Tax=Streptomyces griseus TaxID=1911 RepID=UPI00379F9278